MNSIFFSFHKKIISLVLIFVFGCSLGIILEINVYALENVGTPSFWAQKEVDMAIEAGIVPKELMKNYQKSITREEYTVLAMRLLDFSNINTYNNSSGTPFSDIEGSKYKDLLIKAYNARIIDGYPDKTFKPDKEITREEIAALVVKILRAIYKGIDNIDINKSEDFDFVDKDKIAQWARPYINYCYQNDILRGIEKLRIDPKGNATIEQAILLLYRLGVKNGLVMDEKNKMIVMTILKDNKTILKGYENIETSIKNVFEGNEQIFYSLLIKDNFDLIEVKENSLFLNTTDGNYFVKVLKNNSNYKIQTEIKDYLDKRILNSLKLLLELIGNKEKCIKTIDYYIDLAIRTENMNFTEKVDNGYQIKGETIVLEDKTKVYSISISKIE